LTFAIDFVRKIKPHYSFPLFTLLKKIGPTEVDIDDQLYIKVTQRFRDPATCTLAGALAWDDSDGSGACRNHYDDAPPQFVHDSSRLCPSMDIWAVLAYSHPGGAWPWDTLWAYDDGGGTDRIPLRGPDSSPPSPYGPLVGTIPHDASVTAGVYHRGRTL